jgi:hypothetical protein
MNLQPLCALQRPAAGLGLLRHGLLVLAALLLALARPAAASTVTYDFEGYADSTSLTTQIAGLTFANALILKAGIGLDETQFPPHSGSNGVLDDGGAIRIDLAAPVSAIGAWFTYLTRVTFSAYDSSNTLLGSSASLFTENYIGSGSGGSPNEYIGFVSATGNIARVVITGDPSGSSFVMDDLTVPEPGTLALVLGGLVAAGARRAGAWRRQGRAGRAGRLAPAAAALCLAASGVACAGTLGTPAASPDRVTAGAATAVTFSISITDPKYSPGSANVQRLNADGSVQGVVGLLHDDGLDGDAVAGDGVFTLRTTLTETATSLPKFQVSAGFKGEIKRSFSTPLSLAVFSLDLTGNGAVARTLFPASYLLTTATDPGTLTDFSAYALPAAAAQPSQNFQGTLTLNNTATSGGFTEVVDTYNYTGAADTTRKHLPPFSFQFIQTGSHIFPLQRGSIASSHPEWEFVLAPGRAWDETGDGGYSRASIPFALQQKNANCIHNGALTFLFKSDGSISKVAYQIASETCSYFKVNMWGILTASYTPQVIADAATRIAAYQGEVMYRMPTKTLADLATDYPAAGIDVSKLLAPNGTATAHISATGFITGGVHYTGSCVTRATSGYPFCSTVILPSYSTAKSMFAAVAAMRLEKKYPGTKSLPVKTYVPACQTGTAWNNVTLNQTLDMATGNYANAGYQVDESATTGNPNISTNFFLKLTAADKISFACTGYAHKVNPGTTWVYHTSDHYLAGTMMQAYYQGLEGSGKDLYTDLVAGELWAPLKTSPTSQYTRRTYETTATPQPWAAWGLILLPDDVAKIASFIGIARGAINGVQMLDSTELNAALQRTPADRGMTLASPYQDYRYNNGFWAYNVKAGLGCANDTFLPFMSGSGGISVLVMQNDTVYYQFTDNNTYYWLDAAVQSNKIRPLCN